MSFSNFLRDNLLSILHPAGALYQTYQKARQDMPITQRISNFLDQSAQRGYLTDLSGESKPTPQLTLSNRLPSISATSTQAPLSTPTPTPTPTPEPTVSRAPDVTEGAWNWQDLVKKHFPPDQWANAMRIMSAENGAGNPNAIGQNSDRHRSKDYGLFQINDYWQRDRFQDVNELLDPETNVRLAAEIWRDGGWGLWTTAKRLGIE